MNTSDSGTRAVLSVGSLQKTVRPVVFELKQYNSAECNYLVHKQELLAIVCTLQKQHIYLLRVHFYVYTDHCTLKYLDTQYDLSQRQAQQIEDLSQYDYELHYIKGEENTVTDTLSCYLDFDSGSENTDLVQEELEGTIMQISADQELLVQIQNSYNTDEFCHKLCANLRSMAGACKDCGLLYLDD